MKGLVWLVVFAVIGALLYAISQWRRKWRERQAAADARLASFIGQAKPAPPMVTPAPVVPPPAPQERLLFDAAAKAGEAGEPVLSIQLYAKLLSRYPQTQFAAQARAAVEAQKKKLAQA